MGRTYILLFFTYFFFHLHSSGNITKYINMKYAYLSKSAIFIFAILTVVQAYIALKNMKETPNTKESETELCCDHHHGHEESKPFIQRWLLYGIFIFPLILGFF